MKKRRITKINESLSKNTGEKMYDGIIQQLQKNIHSLGPHPALPEGDEEEFIERITKERFSDLVKNYKKQYDVSRIEGPEVLLNLAKYARRCMALEEPIKKELVDMAIKLVMEEFDIAEGDLIINAQLISLDEKDKTLQIDTKSLTDNFAPRKVEIEFEDHAQIELANKEVLKRRFINTMIQGSAKKCSHLFHKIDDEITELNPRLNSNYSKMMAGADLQYFILPDNMLTGVGGIVDVEYPKTEDDVPVINAKGILFPILVHEIVKGVMEVLSINALPEDNKIAEYVIAKADFTAAEPWDMRIGPKIWEKFMLSIHSDDIDLKHHIYNELVMLPVDLFNGVMREILAGTTKGKIAVKSLAVDIREEIRRDDFNRQLIDDDFGDDEYFSPDELDDIDPSLLT
jgi:acetolactate synthase small subunit